MTNFPNRTNINGNDKQAIILVELWLIGQISQNVTLPAEERQKEIIQE
jgi:hypothetical protein